MVDIEPDADPLQVLAVGRDRAPPTPKTYATTSSRNLTDADIDAIADEVATKDYDVDALKTGRRGRPSMGSGPAEIVPVRLDPDLRAAIEARADADSTTTSEVIREALRRFLGVA